MSEKLSAEKKIESLDAIKRYESDNQGYLKKEVIVEKSGKTILDDEISVIVGKYNTYYNVGIMWDEVEFDYKQNGLVQYYSSTYYEVTYENGILKIHSEDIVICII